MTKLLYLDNQYQQEADATVTEVDNKFIVLDQSIFYPDAGGQPFDTGTLTTESGETFSVLYVKKFPEKLSLELDRPGLIPNQKVHCKIDWQRRYLLMRYHTAAHIISGVFNKEAGALITGNQLSTEKGRIDFNLENFDREKITDYFEKSNKIVAESHPIKVAYLSREDAEKDQNLFKLAKSLPVSITTIRTLEIENFDIQADGGTHVKNTKEVGKIVFLSAENKGKSNRRVYFKLE